MQCRGGEPEGSTRVKRGEIPATCSDSGIYSYRANCKIHCVTHIAGWSSQAARRAHNPKVAGSNPVPATE